jgi:Na+/H+ antiporter NhaD/arsenite permease-like protein
LSFDFTIFISLAFLFGIAAQFRAADGYTFLRGLVYYFGHRLGMLYAVVIVTAIFSPFVLNDVLVLILTPVLVGYSRETGGDIGPLLVAEITFTNIASSLTPLGNPQNILLWQAARVSAAAFVAGTWAPLALSAVIAASVLWRFKERYAGSSVFSARVGSWRPAFYLALVTVVVFGLSLVGISSPVALGIGFGLGFLFNLRSVRKVAREFDARSLAVLFVLVGSTGAAGYLLQPLLHPYVSPVASGAQPYSAIFMGLVSNAISNVPATQLVLSTSPVSSSAAPLLAVDAGLAGNIDPIASFANLLGLLIATRSGVSVRRAIIMQLAIGLIAFPPALL